MLLGQVAHIGNCGTSTDGAYSGATVANGFVHTAACIGVKARPTVNGSQDTPGADRSSSLGCDASATAEEQARLVVENLEGALKAAGCTLKVNISET